MDVAVFWSVFWGIIVAYFALEISGAIFVAMLVKLLDNKK